MNLDRRDFFRRSALAWASAGLVERTLSAAAPAPKIGMCEWNVGRSCDPEMIPKAAQVGVKGIQIDVATSPENVAIRDPAVRKKYRELAERHGITIHSVAPAWILHDIPLKTEPQAAVYVIDGLEGAAALGAGILMIPFFRNNDLRRRDSTGQPRKLNEGPFSVYEVDTQGVARVVAFLRQIIPRAEEADILIGLETTITAEQTLEMIDRVGSPRVQVYYDVGNATRYGYDVPSEIQMLGNDRICEIHLKDPGSRLLGAPEGDIDFGAVADACRQIGYDKWHVLETSGREGRFFEDTRSNVAFVQRTFA